MDSETKSRLCQESGESSCFYSAICLQSSIFLQIPPNRHARYLENAGKLTYGKFTRSIELFYHASCICIQCRLTTAFPIFYLTIAVFIAVFPNTLCLFFLFLFPYFSPRFFILFNSANANPRKTKYKLFSGIRLARLARSRSCV